MLHNITYGSVNKVIDTQDIVDLVVQGISKISKIIDCSPPTIMKLMNKYHPEYVEQMVHSGKKDKCAHAVGRVNPRWRDQKGRTYEDIHGAEVAKHLRECRSKWLKENNIRKFNTKVSRPQRMLYDIVCGYYPDAVLDYKYAYPKTGSYFYLDIFVPSIQLNVEYDGMYWHIKNKENGRGVQDNIRDSFLKSEGLTVVRLQYQGNPTREQLEVDFENNLKSLLTI